MGPDRIGYLQQQLKKGYDHYFANSDGHCKSSEGLIEVTYDYGNYWEYREGSKVGWVQIMVYSYVLGPSRRHEFTGDTFDEAYEKAKKAVDEWVKEELECTYDEDF